MCELFLNLLLAVYLVAMVVCKVKGHNDDALWWAGAAIFTQCIILEVKLDESKRNG